jgi:CheY-like chemotaxis protein
MRRNALLLCGVVSSVLYVAMTALIPLQWEGYSSAAQTISELSAIGAPTRAAWTLPAAVYTVLVTAFGWGVWRSSGANRALSVVGRLIVVYGSLGLIWPFAPMHQREMIAAGGGTASDTLHLVLAGLTVSVMLLALGVGAAAFGRRFRYYSIASLATLAVFGPLTFLDAPRLAAGLPTPRLGVWERINVGVFLAWVVVLAVTALRAGRRPDRGHAARILVVDDERLIRWSLGQALGRHGCTVTEAANAQEAQAALRAGPFDAVVLDYRLPDTTELELLRLVRAVSPRSHIVMMTAFGAPEMIDEATDLGVSCVLEKPLDLEDACRVILHS